MKKILSGNEAAARGAWEAGAMVGAGYPGTPSTEILENFVKYPGVYAEWSANEKVAADIAIGATYKKGGVREIVVVLQSPGAVCSRRGTHLRNEERRRE